VRPQRSDAQYNAQSTYPRPKLAENHNSMMYEALESCKSGWPGTRWASVAYLSKGKICGHLGGVLNKITELNRRMRTACTVAWQGRVGDHAPYADCEKTTLSPVRLSRSNQKNETGSPPG
jgi:hypothetical protein